MAHRVLVIDNNAVRKLAHPKIRDQLRVNLRVTGREFWPTAMNVAEAMKSRDSTLRKNLLNTLHTLAGQKLRIDPTDGVLEANR